MDNVDNIKKLSTKKVPKSEQKVKKVDKVDKLSRVEYTSMHIQACIFRLYIQKNIRPKNTTNG